MLTFTDLVVAALIAETFGLAVAVSQMRRIRSAFDNMSKQNLRLTDEMAVAAALFDGHHGILITDKDGRALRVNRAFSEITGYTEREIVGRKPGEVIGSGRHGPAFYESMWSEIKATGRWQGEIIDRRKDGEQIVLWHIISEVRDVKGDVRFYVSMFTDVTWRHKAEEEIERLAWLDPLTGLANKRMLLKRLQRSVEMAKKHKTWGALLFVDIDQFKHINDSLGHAAGDTVLRTLANRMQRVLRAEDTIARIGGDEFVVLLHAEHETKDAAADAARTVANKILAQSRENIRIGEYDAKLSSSIGITLFGHMENVDENVDAVAENLIKQADLAMYDVKQNGRDNVRFFDLELQARADLRFHMRRRIVDALANDRFVLYLQPQFDSAGNLVGCEALVRWMESGNVILTPSEFINIAEESGLIVQIGDLVMAHAIALLKKWRNDPVLGSQRIAVNVSPKQFNEAGFVGKIVDMLCQHGLVDTCWLTADDADAAQKPGLEIEITESAFLTQSASIKEKLRILRMHGVSIAMDDFGTGYSSLAYLADLKFDVIKLDMMFVMGLSGKPEEMSCHQIVKTIIDMGHNLGMRVVAEGVESPYQQNILMRLGCDIYQGHLYGHPMPVRRFEEFARKIAEDRTAEKNTPPPNVGGGVGWVRRSA